ncbi:MAG TPA: hypothetical protein VGI40_12735 [Pirellulaceae bacterium]|jgi:hypothetical protein
MFGKLISRTELFAALAIGFFSLSAVAGEPVTVELQNGHVVQGETDEQTDDVRLWLRREADGVQLASGFPWDQVRQVTSGDRVLPGREFFAAALGTKSAGKTYQELPYASRGAEPVQSASAEAEIPAKSVSEQFHRKAVERRVKSLYIEAYLAQWDGDPQTDGLRVFVYPLSADGELVPVNGQIDLFLLGEIERATGVVGNPTMPQFRELERGSQLVKAGDFSRGAAMYQLPFRQFHPDFYFDVARQALLHARLGVPGQGVFMASDANVQMRGFSRIRDELQMKSPQRFFPQENAIERPGIMLPQY